MSHYLDEDRDGQPDLAPEAPRRVHPVDDAAEWGEEGSTPIPPPEAIDADPPEPEVIEQPVLTDAEGVPQPEQAPANIPPTQVRHPWRAALRTGLAVVVALPLVDAVVREWIKAFLPPEWTWVPMLWGGVVGVALLVTRVLNVRAVNDLLPEWLKPAPTKTDAELPADAPAELPADPAG